MRQQRYSLIKINLHWETEFFVKTMEGVRGIISVMPKNEILKKKYLLKIRLYIVKNSSSSRLVETLSKQLKFLFILILNKEISEIGEKLFEILPYSIFDLSSPKSPYTKSI